MSHHLVGMAEIAEIIGVSRQRVSQLIETYEDFPAPEAELAGGRVWSRTAIETWVANHPEREPGRPEASDFDALGRRQRFLEQGGGIFERFTDRARGSIVKAQEEARNLNHGYIGTEHLLLGLVALGEGAAFHAVESLDVSLESLRKHIVEMIGTGPSKPEGHIPFTPRAKKVLEASLGEALKLGHNYVGTEHILLGLVSEKDGVAWKTLAKENLEQSDVRHAVMATLVRYVTRPPGSGLLRHSAEPRPAPAPKRALMCCSFCDKPQTAVAKLIAGPGVFICSECIDLCVEIITEEEKQTDGSVADRLAQIEKRLSDLEDKP